MYLDLSALTDAGRYPGTSYIIETDLTSRRPREGCCLD